MRVVPKVKAVRIEESWQVPGMRVRCVAHLTRALSPEEARIMEAGSKFRAAGATITYVCRPGDFEEWASLLENELGRAVRAGLSTPSRRYSVSH